MTIISRYIFRQAFAALLLILGSLTGVVWIALALKQLEVVTNDGQDVWTFFVLTTLAVPNLIGFVAPVAALIATIHVLNRLNTDSELIILTASGATIWLIARPLLILAGLISVVVVAINFYGMPASLKTLRTMILDIRSDLIGRMLQPGRFSSPERHLTVHIRARAANGDLRGVLMHDGRKPKDIVSLTAERGRIVKQGQMPLLLLRDGHIIRQPNAIAPAEVIKFEQYAVELDSFQKAERQHSWKPRERYLGELLNPAPDDRRYERSPGKFRAELHERFSSPLYPFAFVLIALASVGQAQSTRANRTQAMMTGFVYAVVLRLAGLAANNLVTLNAWAVPLLYLIPLGGITLAIAVMYRNSWPRPGLSWQQKAWFAVEDSWSAILARLPRLKRPAPAAAAED